MKEEKTQLQEGTIRRFMKLAGTQPLASDFVNENYPPVYKDDEELEAPDELELDLDAPDDLEAPPEPELEPEDIAGEGEVTLTDEDVDTLLAALDAANALADKLRGAAEEAAPEELEAAELELPPEPPVDSGAPLDIEVEEEEELEEAVADVDVVDDEKLVKEVYKRVAKRLSELKGE